MPVTRIRRLRADDYDRLIRLWNEAGLDHRPLGRDRREGIEREISGPMSIFLVAEEGRQMVGVVLGTHDGRKGWINRLAVAPGVRGRGIGRALVDAVEAQLAALGIGIVTCLIEEWNADSMRFFEAIGYVEHRECTYYSKRMRPDI